MRKTFFTKSQMWVVKISQLFVLMTRFILLVFIRSYRHLCEDFGSGVSVQLEAVILT